MATPRVLEVRRNILKENDVSARALRDEFARRGLYVANFVSSPGAGKTALLATVLPRLLPSHRVAAVVGDLATDNDARRLAASGAAVRQIETGSVCHLDVAMLRDALKDWDLEALDFLFIENVGNLVCPAGWDLGEDLRVLLFSTTEGEDKPLKYPTLIQSADVVIVSKTDLAVAAECDLQRLQRNVEEVRPGVTMLETSAKTGRGVDSLTDLLLARRREKLAATT